MAQEYDVYSVRPSGPAFEILDLHGRIIAWVVDAATAQAIVSLLNLAHVSGLLTLNHEDTE